MSENGAYKAKITTNRGSHERVTFCAGSECETKRKIFKKYPDCKIEEIYPIKRPDYEHEIYKKYSEIDELRAENQRLRQVLEKIANSAGDDGVGYTTGSGHSDCVWQARAALEVK